MAVIKVPKTPRSAFQPGRPAGQLLLAQVEHLEHAVGLPFRKRKRLTEGEAAEYIRQLTARLLGGPEPAAADMPRPKKPAKRKPAKKPRAKKARRRPR
jgi:hypothetical protein